MERKKILTGKMSLDLRKWIIKCLVWSVALYAAETWAISRTDIKKTEAFEMWLWRRMEKISWTAQVSNSEVLSWVMEDHCIINTIRQRKRKWLRRVLRHDVLLRDILEGRMLGKRTRGRKRGNFLQVSKEASWRQMSVKSFRDGSQWPAIYTSTPEVVPLETNHIINIHLKESLNISHERLAHSSVNSKQYKLFTTRYMFKRTWSLSNASLRSRPLIIQFMLLVSS